MVFTNKHFQAPFSSAPLQWRQKSSCSPKQLPPLKKKLVQATTPPLLPFSTENKIDQFYMCETRILTIRSHLKLHYKTGVTLISFQSNMGIYYLCSHLCVELHFGRLRSYQNVIGIITGHDSHIFEESRD